MAKNPLSVLVIYDVDTGDGSGSYDAGALYDDWAEAVADIKAALDHGRQVLIETTWMTQAEYDQQRESDPEEIRRLRGEGTR